MTDVTEFLAEQKRLAAAATEGPWFYQPWSDYALPSGDYAESILLSNAADDGEVIRGLADEDGAFIAAARESVPRLVAALEAVNGLHRRSHAVFSWASGDVRYDDPCPECDGKAGVHPCGCWADCDIEYVCSECKVGHKGASVPWPCPTIRAIEAALGGGSTDE